MRCFKNCHRDPRLKIKLCSTLCVQFPKSPVFIWPRPFPPPPSPPSPLSPANNPHGNTLLLLSLIATATLVGAIFMLCLLFKKLRDCRNSSRNRPALFDVRGANSSDGDEEGSIFDHHIWYINTVGLQQSVIDSIAMFKYRKDEKLIDGSDCSICLGEFQDDESLRLLPKCSHAFHVPCIDTWLRSNKNCPLCRAPVMPNPAATNPTALEPVTNPSPPMETEAMEEENRVCEGENSEIPKQRMSRTLSDLSGNQNREGVENEGQAMRRSVSMDLVSAMAIYQATANIQIPEQGSSSKNVAFPIPKLGIGNQSLYNLVKSISFGRSVPKGAISMKRFSSGGRKLKGARHYRSQSSVLPL